jgi:radical SAM enzyme (TIGR01210 family)
MLSNGAPSSPAEVRSLRPARPPVDPWAPLGVAEEEERQPDGSIARAATLFLAGAECPWACVFCDLWRYTLDGATPADALPTQIETALAALRHPPDVVKLYNASNFFDPRAVPPEDDEAIAALVRRFGRVVVECHPRLAGERAAAFARRLDGRLEVALGLETIDPRAAPHLGKGATLDDFARAASFLRAAAIDVRVFLLVGVPYVPPAEQVEAAVASARFACDRLGATHVSLIPVRGGNGALERLAATGDFTPPGLAMLEASLDACLEAAPDGVVVTADLWDLERLAACGCFPARRARLERASRSGLVEARILCAACSERS